MKIGIILFILLFFLCIGIFIIVAGFVFTQIIWMFGNYTHMLKSMGAPNQLIKSVSTAVFKPLYNFLVQIFLLLLAVLIIALAVLYLEAKLVSNN